MKYAILSCIAVCVFALAGCQVDSQPTEEKLGKETLSKTLDIATEIEEFNSSQLTNDSTRAKELTTDQWLMVASADGLGAYRGAKLGLKIGRLLGPKGALIGAGLGGVIVGGSASYATYHHYAYPTRATSNSAILPPAAYASAMVVSRAEITREDYSLGLALGLDSCYVETGLMHNMILDRVEIIEVSQWNASLSQLSSTERDILQHPMFIEGYENISASPFTGLETASRYDDYIMNKFISGVKTSCRTQEDINRFISFYTDAVKRSTSISAEDKENLYTGFSVAGYSWQYWSDRIIIDDDEFEVL